MFYCCGSGSLSCFVQFRIVPVSVSPNLFVYMFFFPSSLSPINLAVQSGLPSALLSLEATLSWMLLCSEDLKSGTALTAAQTTSLCTSDVQDWFCFHILHAWVFLYTKAGLDCHYIWTLCFSLTSLYMSHSTSILDDVWSFACFNWETFRVNEYLSIFGIL